MTTTRERVLCAANVHEAADLIRRSTFEPELSGCDPVVMLAKKSATNLLDQIEASKQRDLSNLIYALGLRHVGDRTAATLAR